MGKKVIRLLAAGLLFVTLAACGKKKDEVVTLTPAIDPVQEQAAPAAASETSPEAIPDGQPAGSGGDTQPEETAAPSAETDPAVSVPVFQQNEGICFANLTGRDIVKLQISFSAGDAGTLEVLGEHRLYDGDQYVYSNDALNGLYGMAGLKLNVTATAKDATVMLFPEVEIMDLSRADVILYTTKEGYAVRIR